MARLFIGIMVPEEVKTAVSDVQSSVAKLPIRAKLVGPENLHISLSFLGNVPDEDIPKLAEALDRVCAGHRRFTVRVGGMMLIPNEQHLRVVALGVKGNDGAIEELREEVAGFIGGDSKSCHLTLARVREVRGREFAVKRLKELDVEKYFEVSSVCLVKSIGTRDGRAYWTLHESKLK